MAADDEGVSDPMPRPRQDSDRAVAWRLFGLLFLVFGLLSQGHIVNTDAEVEFQSARSLWLRGSPGLSDKHADASLAETWIASNAASGNKLPAVVEGLDGDYYTWFGIGHTLTMAPFYAVGRELGKLFASTEDALGRSFAADPQGIGAAMGDEFFARLAVSFHAPLFGALTGVVLFLLLGWFGFSTRHRIIAVLLAASTTQFGPGTKECMSNVVDGCFLLLAVERALAWSRNGKHVALLAAGIAAGFAVLCRNAHAVTVIGLFVYVAWIAWRRSRIVDLRWFIAGGALFAVFLLWFNYARFGSVTKTGYHTLTNYWSFNPLFGFPLLALSPGKGMLWFSPLLWLVPLGLRRLGAPRADMLLLVWVLASAWVLNSFTSGWHSSQAWGCRYLTTGVVLLVAVTVASLLRAGGGSGKRLRLLVVVATLGGLVTLGGWLAPYRGYYELGHRAIAAKWPQVPVEHHIQYLVSEPRMTPIFGHWAYAWLSLDGAIPDGPSEVVHGLMFGRSEQLETRITWPEDTGFRHVWPIGLWRRLDSSMPLVIAGLLAGLAALLAFSVAAAARAPRMSDPESSHPRSST
ncbi:MAG: hypothetical protein CMJ85_00710 [Planctomycetes bacterium]|nr:hypothetical protein [Planctomycetota bacterium]